ncbi:hypothetical protein, partial [Acinetobacter baumannii]|uniref:hypothetical protein n=1 Tax=Acinetobacter baumannii TaxID=470 RepID=UPI0020912AD9
VTAASAQASSTVMSEGDTPLPDQVAFLPVARPEATFPVPVPAGAGTVAGNTPQPLAQPAQTAEEAKAVAQQVAAGDAAVMPKAQA